MPNKNSFSKVYLCLVILFSSPFNFFGQESVVVFETQNFSINRINVQVANKSKEQNPVKDLKFSHFELMAKNNTVKLNEDPSKTKYAQILKLAGNLELFKVYIDGKIGILDLNVGKVIIDIRYKSIDILADNFFILRDKAQIVCKLDGSKLINYEFKDVKLTCDLLYDNGSKNLILFDLTGKKIAEFASTKIVSCNENELILNQKEKFGIINREGKIMLPFEYDDAFFGDQYLSLGKKTAGRLKYRLYSNGDLQNPIFNEEFDFIKDISINASDSSGRGFVTWNAEQNEVAILKENKKVFKTFKTFKESKESLKFATNLARIDLYYDFVLTVNQDELFQVYCNNGDKLSDQTFDYFTNLDDTFPGYVFFISVYKETFATPQKIGNGINYKFPFEVFSLTKLSEKAYLMACDYGDNIFRPSNKDYILLKDKREMYFDWMLAENMQIGYFTQFNGNNTAYDILKDSLFLSPKNTSNQSNQTLLSYISAISLPYLKMFQQNVNQPILELNENVVLDQELKYVQYTDENSQIILDKIPFKFNFAKLNTLDGGVFFVSSIEAVNDPYFTFSAVLDSKLKLISSYKAGFIQQIVLLKNDTIVQFYGESDTASIYSTRHKKTIYFKDLQLIAGTKNFYPKLTSFGIMNEFGKNNGLVDYSGKVLVPFNYELYENEGFDVNPHPVLDLVDNKGIHHYYFVETQKMVLGCKTFSDNYIPGEYICLQTKANQYQIFNRRTSNLVFEETFNEIIFNPDTELGIVISGNLYGLFDFKRGVWAEDLKYGEEEFYKIFNEKY